MMTSIEQQEIIIKDIAIKIVGHGFSVPAIFFLEMIKYLSFFGSQVLVFFGPLLTIFINSQSYYNFSLILEDRKNVEKLLLEIERMEALNKWI